MSNYTCISCHVAFKDGEIQRLHYKCDWHRYNLKRKVAELPPVTAEEFEKRVLQQRINEQEKDTEKSVHCISCRKTFTNQNAYQNHLNSKKHKDNEKFADTPADSSEPAQKYNVEMEVEEVDSDEWEDDTENPIENNNCLFCSHHSSNLVNNVQHMSYAHTFFVPDIEYCIDLRGLLMYLGEKINDGFMCLWCNEKGRTFHSAEAARNHMLDKGHCRIIHEGLALAEYADFYDYSLSYPDADDANVDIDQEVDAAELDGSEYQLVLPSGAVVGHRSLMRYYKQSLDPNRVVTINRNTRKLHKVLAHYRAIGWSPMQQEAAARKARDIHYMKRLQAKWNTKLSLKANKLQKHFRPQVNF